MELVYKCNRIKEMESHDFFSFSFRKLKYLDEEMNIEFICNYFDDLIIVKSRNDFFKIYKFENKSLHFYEDFPFQFEHARGIIKLKNNNLIMYSGNVILVIKHI